MLTSLSEHLTQEKQSEQSTLETPTPPPNNQRVQERPVHHVKIIPKPQEMNEFYEKEMKQSSPVVKCN